MRYHDFHLSSYLVSDYGSRIMLNLVFDYPGRRKEESHIEFSDVACYRFSHTGGAIITDIFEEPVDSFVQKEAAYLFATATSQGLPFWEKDAASYLQYLQKERYRAWRLDSAVGFTGFVVAKKVEEKPEAISVARANGPERPWLTLNVRQKIPMSESTKPRRGTDPRALFLFLGALWLIVVSFELVTGKILSRHGAVIAVRSDSPVTYWLLALLSLAPTVVMFYVGTRRTGGSK